MRGDDTETDDSLPGGRPGDERRGLTLSVAYHPDAALVGRVLRLPRRGELVLGRDGDALGPGALADRKLSRRHASLALTEAGAGVTVCDLGSRNGTFVNGLPVERDALRPGDVVAIGSALLLVNDRAPAWERPVHPSLVGVSAALAEVLLQAAKVAPRPTTVLIVGETGVGKELVAQEVHARSERAGAFAAVNCAALVESVAVAELFGAARGAFTGAHTDRIGLIERSAGGTLLLDEIADAPPAVQVGLLRVLQEGTFRRVGDSRERRADVRYVAATQRDPGEADHGLREDLLGRLSRYVIRVPPLRERREDIPHLAAHFARRFAGPDARVGRGLMLRLLRYDWPRNVRELEGVLERAAIEGDREGVLTEGPWCDAALPTSERGAAAASGPRDRVEPPRRPERPSADALRERFVALGGNVRALSRELGVSRTSLYRWLDEAGVDRDQVREQGDG